VTAWRISGVHHVQLAMPPGQEDVAERFYAGVLGMERIPKPPHLEGRGGCWFRAGGLELHLGVEDGFRASAKAHPALRVEGLDALRTALREVDADVTEDTQLEGHDRCYVRDPFGNRVELIEERSA
jgi:catechol 2,3-dioxygenase-like lactoylglutathione lyase family enzyme